MACNPSACYKARRVEEAEIMPEDLYSTSEHEGFRQTVRKFVEQTLAKKT